MLRARQHAKRENPRAVEPRQVPVPQLCVGCESGDLRGHRHALVRELLPYGDQEPRKHAVKAGKFGEQVELVGAQHVRHVHADEAGDPHGGLDEEHEVHQLSGAPDGLERASEVEHAEHVDRGPHEVHLVEARREHVPNARHRLLRHQREIGGRPRHHEEQ